MGQRLYLSLFALEVGIVALLLLKIIGDVEANGRVRT